MCDFQYLPVVQRDDGSQEALLDKLVMNKLTPQSEYMSRDAPLFLSPILFSRLDSPSDFGLMLSNPCEDPSFQQPTETVAVGMLHFRCLLVCCISGACWYVAFQVPVWYVAFQVPVGTLPFCGVHWYFVLWVFVSLLHFTFRYLLMPSLLYC